MMAVGRRRLWQRTALRMWGQLGPGACVQASPASSLPPSSSSSSPSSSSWGVCVQRKESSPFHQLLPSIGFRFNSRVGKVLHKANTEIYIFKCLYFLSFLTLFSHRHIRISTTLQKSFWLSVIVWHIPHQNFHYIWLLWCFVKFNFFSCFPFSNLFELITGRGGQGFGPLVTSVQCMAIRKLHSSKEYTKCISPNCQMFFSKLQDVFAYIAKYMLGLWSLMCSG